jgi:transposase
MRTLQLCGHLTNDDLVGRLSSSRNSPTFSRWQILYLIQVGNIHSAELISPLVGLSHPSIYKIVEGYNKNGPSSVAYKPRGGRRRALLSIEEEQEVLLTVEQDAAKGLIKTAADIRKIVERKVGKPVSDDFLWDMFNRNGWKKKIPRPHHPKKNLAAQTEFKKNSPKTWMP